jgi:hypothetical protein
MSQVLQCTQFCALICSRGGLFAADNLTRIGQAPFRGFAPPD